MHDHDYHNLNSRLIQVFNSHLEFCIVAISHSYLASSKSCELLAGTNKHQIICMHICDHLCENRPCSHLIVIRETLDCLKILN